MYGSREVFTSIDIVFHISFFAATLGSSTNLLANLESNLRDVSSNPDTSAAKAGLLQILLSGLWQGISLPILHTFVTKRSLQ